nr:MAG TPA: hypothetical protein [Caudoviricetes sp.]
MITPSASIFFNFSKFINYPFEAHFLNKPPIFAECNLLSHLAES